MTDDAIACEEQKVTLSTASRAYFFCSSHAMTLSVIYYSTDARKNEIYLLNTTYLESQYIFPDQTYNHISNYD